MRLDEARGPGPQRAIDVALYPRTSPEATKSQHGR